MSARGPRSALRLFLKTLKLPSFASDHGEVARIATEEGWSYERFLLELCEREVADRQERRIERLLRQSGLPLEKTKETLDALEADGEGAQAAGHALRGSLPRARRERAGVRPARPGEDARLCAVGHELVRQGHAVLFLPAYELVQRLLLAKRELELERAIKRLDRFEAVLIDDIGYVQQDREEMEVLFTFLSERYERRSVMITSNLVFSQWEKIFKDPMTTACAIDRLVHHATILELTGPSYPRARGQAAQPKRRPRRQRRTK